MSTDWNIRCVDCNSVERYNDANHCIELMQALIENASAIAALAPLTARTQNVRLRTHWGEVDIDWFAKHHTHRLVPHDEYGRDLGQCYRSVVCQCCKSSSRPCTLARDHEGACEP